MKKKNYLFITSLISFIFWLITFLCSKFSVNNNIITIIESIQLIIIGLFALIIFVCVEDIFYILPIFCYVPFMFSHPFTAITIPFGIYIALFLAVVGAIIHFIRFKSRLFSPKLLPGICVFVVSIIVGGLFNFDNKYLLVQILFCIVVGILFILGYIFFTSNCKNINFKDIAYLMNSLAIILILQEITYYIINPDFTIKGMNLGWGVSNNLALMLLFTIPFCFYLTIKEEKFTRYIYLFLAYIELASIFLTYSRGSIAVIVLGFIVMLIIGFIYFKKELNLKRYVLFNCCYSFLFIILLIIFSVKYPIFAESLYNFILKGFHFSTLNGRLKIYQEYLSISKNHLIFGHGMLYPLIYHVDVGDGAYQWGHCTYIHTLFTLGIVGLIAINYHFIEKYYSVLKNINLEKASLFLAFLFSGLYGMVDISYFFINYMIVFLITLIMSDSYLEKFDIKKGIRK